MGSGSSKASSSSGSRDRSKGKARVFQPSCLGSLSRSRRDYDNADQVYEPCDKGDDYTQCINQNDTELDNSRTATDKKGEVDLLSETAFVSSNAELQERDVSSMTGTVPRDGSSSIQASVTQPLNPSGRFFSRFSFDPCNVSFRLSRATSLGSSRDYHVTPTNMTRLEDEENLHFHGAPSSGLFNINDPQQSSCLLDSSLVNGGPPAQFDENNFGSRWSNSLVSEPPDNLGANLTISSTQNVGRDIDNARAAIDMNLRTPRLFTEPGYVEPGQSERRAGAREPVERNVRFSRTLSVGRLRDRVLRRSSLSELTYCPVQRDTEASDEGQDSERQGGDTGASATVSNAGRVAPISGYSPTGLSRSLFSIQDNDGDSSRSRDARYRDLLEHRSDFLERRRRIRSQVRALQRLESRFENLSGHERSCILSGQHRSGRCTCRNWNRDPNSNDETTARASISRIVMLAEALFEVLDEIHQQSVVLSSRPSVSSIGSVPAPNEVVDSLPTKVYRKLQTQKNEEAAQCYICLVEYEDGESVRILPCHHEFHRTCVDKWLKEIHRVCPLCRGDICRSESFSADNED